MFDFPDSEIAIKATRLVAETSPQFLYHHAIRAFLFGDALGKRDGLKYDRELLYLGAIMHDLGLNDRFFGEQRFEVEGADVAHRFAIDNKLSDEKAEIIWDAIALHTTVGVALRKRPEIALVCLGTSADTAGRRIGDIGPEMVDRVVAEYPRLGFKKAATALLVNYVKRNPKVVPFTWMSDLARTDPDVKCPTVQYIIESGPFSD